MNYGQTSALKEAVEKTLEKEKIREIIYIRVEDGEASIYHDVEDFPELEEMRDRGLLL